MKNPVIQITIKGEVTFEDLEKIEDYLVLAVQANGYGVDLFSPSGNEISRLSTETHWTDVSLHDLIK